MIKKTFIPVSLALALAVSAVGCASKGKIVYVDRIVEIPVVVNEPIPAPADVGELGVLPVDQIHEGSTDAEVVVAYKTTVDLLRNYVDALEAALQPYIDASRKDKDSE